MSARSGGTRQIHALTSRTDLGAGEVCWRLTSRWREENYYFRYARTWFALDSHAATPDDPGRLVPQSGEESRRRLLHASPGSSPPQPKPSAKPAWRVLRTPAPGQPVTITNTNTNTNTR